MRVNIIGGGLAGCALAYVLKAKGAEPVIYEAGDTLAVGASGNDVGLYNPRFTADFDGIGQFYSMAFFRALEVFEEIGDQIDWSPCGALHFINDDKKAKRFAKTVSSWAWAQEDMKLVDAQEASEISGVKIPVNCLYLNKSGKISPKKICARYAQGVKVHHGLKIRDVSELERDATVLACGMAVLNFDLAAHLPLKAVRGQVSYVEQNDISSKLRCTLGYGGYVAPAENGVHCVGSTFQRWLNHDRILPEDDLANIQNMADNVPDLKGLHEVKGHRAAVRTTSQDHMPIVGRINEGVYVSTAHGSHGVLSSLLSADILSAALLGEKNSGYENFYSLISPDRFFKG